MAADIEGALRMSAEERCERHARLMTALAGNTPERWATTFLDRLVNAAPSACQA